jgi:hypothetical protein
MQKISTLRRSGKNIFEGEVTIGLDLGDRWVCERLRQLRELGLSFAPCIARSKFLIHCCKLRCRSSSPKRGSDRTLSNTLPCFSSSM